MLERKHQPNSKTVIGNSVTGSIPELFLQKTKCDVIVIEEGEISGYEAIEAIRLGKDLRDGVFIFEIEKI
jgi:radical SAM superfamily enzyme YgiQ (UPF0313 family)